MGEHLKRWLTYLGLILFGLALGLVFSRYGSSEMLLAFAQKLPGCF